MAIMNIKTTSILCSLLALSSTAFAADNPWIGTWKLDLTKSNLTGDTFTYSKGPGGLLHYSDGSADEYDFGIDGKEYKGSYGHGTTTWTAIGPNEWSHATRLDGKVLSNVHTALSADGKTLASVASGTRPDGSAFNETIVFTRVDGTDGLVGTWRISQVANPDGARTVVISSPAPAVLRWDLPEVKASFQGRLDGSDLPFTGVTIPPGATMSVTRVSPTQLRFVMKVNGRVDSYVQDTLAADGRSYTDVSWNPGKENEKTIGVLVKQ
jgi:hypothetical protein